MQFINSSLDILVKNLPDNDFKHSSQELNGERLKLVKQKEVYPYKYINSFEKFSEDKIPDRSKFHSSLHANYVRNIFKTNTMCDYHDLYLKTDVLLLPDIFEKFISTCLEYYRFDSCHYFSSPGLSWDAMLKITRIELELISDTDMYLFIEKGMRGGISYIAKRYSKANNKYTQSYDNEKTKYT